MDFNTVIDDIEGLTGQRLNSISPGCEITIEYIDREAESIRLRTSTGQPKSRPFSEIRTLWTALTTKPIVHVEGALHGSGSSRNQPETILANLPYVEWLRYDRKKHIAYVGRRTHAPGTLRQMSQQDIARIKTQIEYDSAASEYRALFVTEDVATTGRALSQKLGNEVSPLSEGFYKCQIGDETLLVCTESVVDLRRGVYTFIEPGHAPASIDGRVKIGRYTYAYINIEGERFLSRE